MKNKHLPIIIVLAALLLPGNLLFGQDSPPPRSFLESGLSGEFLAPPREDILLPPADSAAEAKPKIKLLPDHLSLMESALWGESGLMRITGIAPLTPSARKSELGVRRFMLTAHQIGGFVTMGLFIPTLIYGQKNIDQWNASESGHPPYTPINRSIDRTHRNLATILFASYMATASLSIFSPPPLIRRDDWGGTTSIHKSLAWVHFAGMLALPFLGSAASSADHHGNISQAKNLRTIHQVVAYTTAAAFTASLIIMTF